MKNKIIYSLIIAGTLIPFMIKADPATPVAAPNGSVIRTNLNVDLDKKTNTLHLISTNNDPYIYTKTYVLKHADPYEIRPYLRSAASSNRITGADDFVSCIKYKDGTGIVMVSAEEYKFSKDAIKAQGVDAEDCMCIGDIVKKLDLKGMTSSSGQGKFMYFPKYRNAQEIATMAQNSGLNVRNDATELLRGADSFAIDPGLNAVLFYANPYNLETIYGRLAIYDQPLPEAQVSVKVYEIDYENDGKVGTDFQAWKNGPGTDLFSVASRFGHGMNPAGLVNGTQWSRAKYVQLSPRWNTRFLDFLAAKGKAHTVVEGTLNIRNNTEGFLQNTTGIPNFTDGTAVANNAVLDYETITARWVPWGGTPTTGNDMTFVLFDSRGTPMTINQISANTSLVFGRINDTGDNRTQYTVKILTPGSSFVKDGKNIGTKITGYNLAIQTDTRTYRGLNPTDGIGNEVFSARSWTDYTSNWSSDNNLTVQRSFQRDTQTSTYGFQMTVTPTICKDSTTLNVNMQNTSLIGFTENANGAAGAARTLKSEVNTSLMVNNENNLFLVGGLEKTAVVRSLSKVPWLGSIPLIGWVFTSESEVTKKSKLVAVIQCKHQEPTEAAPADFANVVKTVDKDTIDAGKTNSYGYDQWILDKDKKSLNKLP